MKHNIPNSNNRHGRAVIAGLVCYVLLASQLTPLALALNPGRRIIIPVSKAKAAAAPANVALQPAPVITATKFDSYAIAPGPALPGETITYNITISNTGTADATGVTFNDTIDANTTLVPGSVNTSPITGPDSYSVLGNVRIQPNAANGLLVNDIDPDTGTNTGLTASGPTTSTQGGNVNVNSDGSFSYNPPAGFEGTDTFTYTATDAGGKSGTGTVTLTVTGMIWFVNVAAAAGGDGRLTTPFNCLVGAGCFSAVNDGLGNHPASNDNIFLASGAYTGGLALLPNQKVIGQGASASLTTIAGVTVPANSDTLPTTGGAAPTITTVAPAQNGLNLGTGNTVRGIAIGNTTGAKLSSVSFGTLTLGNNTTPDVLLNGSGQALSLSNGTFAATSALTSLTSTSSTAQGISLSSVTGTISFGSTTISGNTTQCILVSGSTANITFGNTSCTGGTDGVSLQNNSAGTRTFGTLSVSGGSGSAFLHGAGGGNTTVSGAATLTSGADAISISAPTSGNQINFNGATSATRTTSGGNGVNWAGTAGATLLFSALTIQTNAGTGLNASGGGTITVSNNTGTINNTTQAAPAIVASGIALNAVFASINSSGGTNGVSLTNVTGTSN